MLVTAEIVTSTDAFFGIDKGALLSLRASEKLPLRLCACVGRPSVLFDAGCCGLAANRAGATGGFGTGCG